MKNKGKILSLVAISALSISIMGGCQNKNAAGKKKATSSDTTVYPVKINNFTKVENGKTWSKKVQTFDTAPKRILANTQPAAELLLHLGLKDRIAGVGAVFGVADQSVAKDFKDLKKLSTSYIGKEMALSVNPDLVYGRGGLFDNADWGNGTVGTLNEMGISTYVLNSSVTGGKFNSVYQDIKNLGKIFNVPGKAARFSKELKTRQKKVETNLSSIKENKSFAYLHMSEPETISVYAANGETFFNDIFKMVKLDNIFASEKGEVSVETLIKTNPDVLIVPDWHTYGDMEGMKADTMIKAVLNNPKLASMQAVKNKQVYAVDYNYMFGYGYQSLDGIEKLAQQMYPKLVKAD